MEANASLPVCSLLAAQSGECRAGEELPPAAHAGWLLVYLHSGNIRETCGTRQVLLHPGALLLHAPGEQSGMCPVGALPPAVLRLEFAAEGEALERLCGAVLHTEPEEQRDLHYIMRMVPELFVPAPDGTLKQELPLGAARQTALRLEDLLILLMRRSRHTRRPHARLRRERRQAALVEEARSYFAANLRRELHIGELCAAIGCSRAQLQQAYRARVHSTAGQEFSAMRLDFAAQLLARGDSPGEVAAEMGYSSGAHFSQCFKAATGNTPAEYRRLQLGLPARRGNRQQKDKDERETSIPETALKK